MKRLLKKTLNRVDRHLLEIIGMCAAAMLLVVAAVFISQGGMSKLNHVLAMYGITAESQTGCIFPCNNTAYTMEALIPMQNGSIVNTVAPGTNVNWQWNAGSYGSNRFMPVCTGATYGSAYVCTIQRDTPNLNFGACQQAYTTGGECTSTYCAGGTDKWGTCIEPTCTAYAPTVYHPAVNCGNADDIYGNACFGPSGGTVITGWQPGCQWATNGSQGYDGNAPASTVTMTAPSTPGTYTYYFCSNWLLNYAPQGRLGCLGTSLTVTTPPSPPTMSASPQRVVYNSNASTLTWASNNQPAGTYCRVYSGVGLDNPGTGSGTLFQDGDTTGNYSGSKSTGLLTRTWSYDLYCSNGQNAMTTVYVDPAITASPATIASGQSSTITWHAGDQTPGTNCTVYSAPETTTNPALLSSGYSIFDTGHYNSSKSTGPLTQSTSYGIYCPDGAVDGPQGYQTNWVTVFVGTPPSCTLAASPNPVAASGNTSTLTYSATGATSGSIDNGVGAVSTTPGATVIVPPYTSNATWTAPSGVTSVQYLVVAGGGGGGSGYGGGGGGAGGVLAGTLAVTPGNSYAVTVGGGGAGAAGSLNGGYGGLGGHGSNSSFASLTAIGGGGGAYGGGAAGGSGGGGGGNGGTAGGAGTAGQGYSGGAAVAGAVNYGGGGGGGAGGSGSQAPSSRNGGAGGPGYTSSIGGTSRVYAAGGGGGGEGGTGGVGGSSNTGGHGGAGASNVGITSPTYYGSGGGGGGSSAGGASGTAGFQGIVILSYVPPASGTKTTPAITTTPTTFTMTVNNSTSGLSGTCSVPVTITDVCTDISGFQSAAPAAPCVTPVPSPGLCIPSGYTHNGSTCVPSVATISGFAGPTRVRKGNTATLTYTITNPPATCSITGTNGFNTSVSPTSGVQGSVITSAITANTTFTLMCGTVSRSATVGITPEFQEI